MFVTYTVSEFVINLGHAHVLHYFYITFVENTYLFQSGNITIFLLYTRSRLRFSVADVTLGRIQAALSDKLFFFFFFF